MQRYSKILCVRFLHVYHIAGLSYFSPKCAATLFTMVWASFLWLSMVHPATWGLSTTRSLFSRYSRASGFVWLCKNPSKELFSYSNTSNPAPSTLPVFSAFIKSALTTAEPLPVFSSQIGCVNACRKLSFTRPMVWVVWGRWRLRTVALCCSSFRDTRLAP